MSYGDLIPALIANQLAVVTPGRIYQSPFPKWNNPNATYAYHGGTPGHLVEQCMALKHKVQSLIEAGWLTFQEDEPNVKMNPLANHGGSDVNAIEVDKLQKPNHLKDVMTSRRFIFEALQEASVVPLSGHKGDPCLMHPAAPHDMKTCLVVEELLQRMIDQGRLEIGEEGMKKQHVCMQSVDKESPRKSKPLVIHFT